MTEILKWVTETLQAASMGPMAFPLAFLLGLVSALASACCTLPTMGMLVAYSGTRADTDRRSAFASAGWFLVGTVLALVILGFVAGLIDGKLVSKGRYPARSELQKVAGLDVT